CPRPYPRIASRCSGRGPARPLAAARGRMCAFLFVMLVSHLGCKKKEAPTPPPAASASPSAIGDHLANGEIPEGREKAFTLALPLHSVIKARFKDSVHVASTHTQEELANFTRARVKDGQTRAGASETRFDNVVVKTDPSRRLTIEIRTSPMLGEFRSQMVVSDVTPPSSDPNLSETDRWKKAGL